MQPAQVAEIVKGLAQQPIYFGVADILAYCQIESSFDELSMRYEPRLRDNSYGLMQILYSTAKDRGYTGTQNGLFDPRTNLFYGICQLYWIKNFLDNHTTQLVTKQLIAGAYNAGVGNVLHGFYVKRYVDEWVEAKETFLKDYPEI